MSALPVEPESTEVEHEQERVPLIVVPEPIAEHPRTCANCRSESVRWSYNEQGIAFCICHTCGCRFWDRLGS